MLGSFGLPDNGMGVFATSIANCCVSASRIKIPAIVGDALARCGVMSKVAAVSADESDA
jgi:hypothetical protein